MRHWDIRCAIWWLLLEVHPSTLPAVGRFEDIPICQSTSNTGLSWELWHVVVSIFILVYLHNEIFHMNGAREPFLFVNCFEDWGSAQFDSNKFLGLMQTLELSMLAPLSALFRIVWPFDMFDHKDNCEVCKVSLLMTWKDWIFALKSKGIQVGSDKWEGSNPWSCSI